MNLITKMLQSEFIYKGKTYKKGVIIYVTSEEYNHIQSIYSSEELEGIYFLTKKYNFDSNDTATGFTIKMTPTGFTIKTTPTYNSNINYKNPEQRLSSRYYNDDSYVIGRINRS